MFCCRLRIEPVKKAISDVKPTIPYFSKGGTVPAGLIHLPSGFMLIARPAVIAIIGILAAMLPPALPRAKDKANPLNGKSTSAGSASRNRFTSSALPGGRAAVRQVCTQFWEQTVMGPNWQHEFP